jgi:putative transcriptional regulator
MNPIRLLRHQVGVTQKRLAESAGTSQPTIASYESGTKSPTLDTIQRLAKALNLEAVVTFVPPMTREDRRSLALHLAIIEKIKAHPISSVERARRTLALTSDRQPDARALLEEWERWLSLPLFELEARCLDTGLLARDMRQVTPFAGLLSARERVEVLKRFRKEDARR